MRHMSVEPEEVEVSAADLLAWAKRLEAILTRDDVPDEVLAIVEELVLWCETGYLEGERVIEKAPSDA